MKLKELWNKFNLNSIDSKFDNIDLGNSEFDSYEIDMDDAKGWCYVFKGSCVPGWDVTLKVYPDAEEDHVVMNLYHEIMGMSQVAVWDLNNFKHSIA